MICHPRRSREEENRETRDSRISSRSLSEASSYLNDNGAIKRKKKKGKETLEKFSFYLEWPWKTLGPKLFSLFFHAAGFSAKIYATKSFPPFFLVRCSYFWYWPELFLCRICGMSHWGKFRLMVLLSLVASPNDPGHTGHKWTKYLLVCC